MNAAIVIPAGKAYPRRIVPSLPTLSFDLAPLDDQRAVSFFLSHRVHHHPAVVDRQRVQPPIHRLADLPVDLFDRARFRSGDSQHPSAQSQVPRGEWQARRGVGAAPKNVRRQQQEAGQHVPGEILTGSRMVFLNYQIISTFKLLNIQGNISTFTLETFIKNTVFSMCYLKKFSQNSVTPLNTNFIDLHENCL